MTTQTTEQTACRCSASHVGNRCYGYNVENYPHLVAKDTNHWIYANDKGALAAIAVVDGCISSHWGDINHLRRSIRGGWFSRELTEYGVELLGVDFLREKDTIRRPLVVGDDILVAAGYYEDGAPKPLEPAFIAEATPDAMRFVRHCDGKGHWAPRHLIQSWIEQHTPERKTFAN